MHLLRVGRRTINFDFMVMAEEFGVVAQAEPEPPLVEVTMHLGRTFRLGGHEAIAFLDRLYQLADAGPGSADGGRVPDTSVLHDPEAESRVEPSGGK